MKSQCHRQFFPGFGRHNCPEIEALPLQKSWVGLSRGRLPAFAFVARSTVSSAGRIRPGALGVRIRVAGVVPLASPAARSEFGGFLLGFRLFLLRFLKHLLGLS